MMNDAYIAGIYEHPLRVAPDRSTAKLHLEGCVGAVSDAGLTLEDVDAFFCASTSGPGLVSMADYLGLRLKYYGSTDIGGASYLAHVAEAANAIAAGKCNVALISLAGRPRSEGIAAGAGGAGLAVSPEAPFETVLGNSVVASYALCARRHMYEFGTTSEQLAWIKVAASHHAQHNSHAFLQQVVTVEDVINSPFVARPLHRLDSCVITDGGGAIVVTRREIASSLGRPLVRVKGAGQALKGPRGGDVDLTFSAGRWSGRDAFEQAQVIPSDIKYASIYDSFTITVLIALEDLGFCEKGQGGSFVTDGNLISGVGSLPFNTDGGGLCNNHPDNRGGMTKVIEAVRQLRGSAHPAVQVSNCDLALAHGTGLSLGNRHGATTLIMERM
jgi:acetyl-CoA C-acetyltransferase